MSGSLATTPDCQSTVAETENGVETQDGVEIEVRDDGPGVPAAERDVLLEGSETAIDQGSGVGLWLVNWAVTRLDGKLAFSANDPRGSVVTVWLPDLHRSPR